MHANDDATGTPDAVPAPQAGTVARGNCQNCGVPLLGDYCYACGQPVKGLVRHFSSLIGDVLDSVFEWDGRTPRTLWPLLAKPGYLTLEYLAGRRVRYVSPFRLFFFLAVITFFVGRFVVSFGDGEVNFAGNPAIANATTVEEVEQLRDEALAKLADARRSLPSTPGADAGIIAAEATVRAQAGERIQALRKAADEGRPPPKPERVRIAFGEEEWDPVTNPVDISWLPRFANDWLNEQIGHTARNIERLREEPGLLKDAMLGAVPTTLFVLLPVFALMLKVLYLFRRRLYMEHLIVALHSHAFLCLALLLVFVLLLLERELAPGGGLPGTVFSLLEAALWVWMPLYLLLMQKRVYGQGWPMTLLKYCVLGICYLVLLTLGAAFTVVIGLVSM